MKGQPPSTPGAAVIEHAERFGLGPWGFNHEPWEGLGYERADPTGLRRWSEDRQRKMHRRIAQAALADPARLAALAQQYERIS